MTVFRELISVVVTAKGVELAGVPAWVVGY